MIKHLGLVMDGNRRWAKKQGFLPWIGHKKGIEAAKKAVEFCLEKQIPYLSLYVFSLENFKRSPEEVSFLFSLLVDEGLVWIEELQKQEVCVRFIGDASYFPAHVKPTIEEIEQATKHGKKLTVLLLFCYGGQQEIIDGIKHIVRRVKEGIITEDHINDELLRSVLWTSIAPEPDLIIRTGGRHSLSNFLLYQAAYSELHFLDCLWPDIQKHDLEHVMTIFEQAQRNFGS